MLAFFAADRSKTVGTKQEILSDSKIFDLLIIFDLY